MTVEIREARRDAGQRPFSLIGPCRHVDGDLQRIGKALETAVVASRLRDLIEAPLGLLDLFARTRVDGGVISDVDHILADRDELAPHREVIDAAAEIVGVDDRGRIGGEPRQILRHGDAAEVVLAEKRLQRDRRRELALANYRARDLEDAAMDLLDEMLAPQEIRDAVERVIVDEDRAQQRLLGLEIVRRRPIGTVLRLALGERFDGRHGRSPRLLVLSGSGERMGYANHSRGYVAAARDNTRARTHPGDGEGGIAPAPPTGQWRVLSRGRCPRYPLQ